MLANYHAHTYRCAHAFGREREYIEQAIKGGFQIFGFSDHTPYPFSNGHESGFRISLSDVDSYFTTLTRLKEEYKKDIEIPIGLEAEYYPAEFDGLLSLLSDYPIEYMILGQHINGNEYDYPGYNGDATSDPGRLADYVRQSIEALETGCFTYMAHPDLINFQGDMEIYCEEMRKLCRRARELAIPLEINFLGLAEGRNYPNPLFWRIAGDEGCKAIFGVDAHNPRQVWNPATELRAERLAAANHLSVLRTVGLVDPVKARKARG